MPLLRRTFALFVGAAISSAAWADTYKITFEDPSWPQFLSTGPISSKPNLWFCQARLPDGTPTNCVEFPPSSGSHYVATSGDGQSTFISFSSALGFIRSVGFSYGSDYVVDVRVTPRRDADGTAAPSEEIVQYGAYCVENRTPQTIGCSGPWGQFNYTAPAATHVTGITVFNTFMIDDVVLSTEAPTQYILVAKVKGERIPQSGGTLELPPSVKACGALKDESTPIPVEIQCLDATTNAPVAGCSFKLNLTLGSEHGGHEHNLSDGTRPLILDPKSPKFKTDADLSVDSDGSNLVYVAPEVSGDIDLKISGRDPNGNPIPGPSYTFKIKSPLQLERLSASGLTIETASHLGAGDYGTAAMQRAITQMTQTYYQFAEDDGEKNPPALRSEGATLIYGGIFDVDHDWAPPHCGHRNGQTIDLSLSQFSGPDAEQQKTWLALAAAKAGFKFFVPGEMPGDDEASHWHANLAKKK